MNVNFSVFNAWMFIFHCVGSMNICVWEYECVDFSVFKCVFIWNVSAINGVTINVSGYVNVCVLRCECSGVLIHVNVWFGCVWTYLNVCLSVWYLYVCQCVWGCPQSPHLSTCSRHCPELQHLGSPGISSEHTSPILSEPGNGDDLWQGSHLCAPFPYGSARPQDPGAMQIFQGFCRAILNVEFSSDLFYRPTQWQSHLKWPHLELGPCSLSFLSIIRLSDLQGPLSEKALNSLILFAPSHKGSCSSVGGFWPCWAATSRLCIPGWNWLAAATEYRACPHPKFMQSLWHSDPAHMSLPLPQLWALPLHLLKKPTQPLSKHMVLLNSFTFIFY